MPPQSAAITLALSSLRQRGNVRGAGIACFAAVAIWSCTDGDPAGPPGATPLVVAPSFQVGPSPFPSPPIDRIGIEVVDDASGSILSSTDTLVDPSGPSWSFDVEIELGSNASLDVVATIQLFSAGAVEWSGRSVPINVAPGPYPPVRDVPVYRGPLDNLDVTSVSVSAPPTGLTVGDSVTVAAVVGLTPGSSASPVVFWATSDVTVLEVPPSGSPATLTGRGPGTATVSVGAGSALAQFDVVVHAVLSITTASLPDGLTGSAYSQTLTATGGDGSHTWSVTTGSLPTGLMLDPATGMISGTPTMAGSASFTVEATSGDGQNATQSLTIDVFDPLAITTVSLPSVLTNTAYSQSVSATGGDGSYSWSVTAGSLPTGLMLDAATGLISGTPTVAGSASFTVEATSGDGQSVSQVLTIDVFDPLAITATSLPDGAVGIAYNQAVSATGGDGSYSWSVTTGSLPTGLMLDAATGLISGTPTVPGSETFTVGIMSGDGQSDARQFTLVVGTLLGRWVDGAGNPITSAGVGQTVSFQICYTSPDVAAFQADISGFSGLAAVSAQGDLDSSGSGVHPACAGTADVLDSGFFASGTADPFTALIVSNAGAPGSGPVGIFEIDFTLVATGTLQPTIASIVSADFSGNALTIVQSIAPLTVN